MKTLRKPTLTPVVVALLTAFVATACNTIRGLGQDTERAGEKIQEKATR